jgi:hypothetical protein
MPSLEVVRPDFDSRVNSANEYYSANEYRSPFGGFACLSGLAHNLVQTGLSYRVNSGERNRPFLFTLLRFPLSAGPPCHTSEMSWADLGLCCLEARTPDASERTPWDALSRGRPNDAPMRLRKARFLNRGQSPTGRVSPGNRSPRRGEGAADPSASFLGCMDCRGAREGTGGDLGGLFTSRIAHKPHPSAALSLESHLLSLAAAGSSHQMHQLLARMGHHGHPLVNPSSRV